MTPHTRVGPLVAFVLIAVAVCAGVFYTNRGPSFPPTTRVLGAVIDVDEAARTVTLLTPYAKQQQYEVPITEDVVIRRTVFSMVGTQETVRQEELNISDLTIGASVTVFTKTPFKRGMDVFPGVREIFAGTREASPEGDPPTRIPTQVTVLQFDPSTRTLEYKLNMPFVKNAPGTKSLVIPEEVPFYTVADPARMGIMHARHIASASDLQKAKEAFLEFRLVSLPKPHMELSAVLILAK
jgi:hypothetical protein